MLVEKKRALTQLPIILFVLALIVISYFNNYHRTLSLPPVSVHAWRQADGASFALNYSKEEMNFFKPQLHNLNSDNFTTGYCVSEAPIIYYFVALLYKLVGYNEWMFRLTTLLIIFSALTFLYYHLNKLLGNPFLSAFVSLLPFASGTFSYYANGFIPDFVSVSFIILSFVQILNFFRHKKKRSILLFCLFVTIAGLLKITNLIPFIAFLIVFGLSIFIPSYRNIFSQKRFWGLGILLSLIIIISWYAFVLKFNANHGSSYFANEIHPAFKYSWQAFLATLDKIWMKWNEDWFHRWVYYLLGFSLLFTFFLVKKRPLLVFYFVLLLGGTIFYFVLWFDKFNNHDYYISPFITLAVSLVIGLSLFITQFLKNVILQRCIGAVLLLLLFFPIIKASEQNNKRYSGAYSFSDYKNYREIGAYLKKNGFDRSVKVISNDDNTFAVSLYLMDVKGWTNAIATLTPFHTISLKEKGASFILFKGDDAVKKYPLKQMLEKEYATSGDLRLFDIRESAISIHDFYFDTLFCDMESLGGDKIFLTSHPYIFPANADCRTNEKSFSGNYSVKVNSLSPYALTTIVPFFRPGDSLIFSFKYFSKKPIGQLIINNTENNVRLSFLQNSQFKPDEWCSIRHSIKLPEDFSGDNLHFYFYNKEKEDVYIDDLEVVRAFVD
jgi:hypothetical protein